MTETQLPKPIIPSQVSISVLEDENNDDAINNQERIPFTKCTHHNKYLESDKQAKFLNRNKENRESPKRVSSPRSKVRQPLENADSVSTNTPPDIPCDRPVTPTPESSEATPLTPTANLKMLFSAVSPELRNREKSKGLFTENRDNEEDTKLEPLNLDSELAASQSDPDFNDWKPGSRKEKSLGLLCQKFLQRYPEYPFPGQLIEISLDEISKDLNVERRRIYDIVNVLESVEIVSRVAKNKYAWHGKTNLVNTLAKLKALGEAEGVAEQIHKIKDYELTRELDEQNGRPSSSLPPFNLDIDNPSLALLRKDKSLGIMSQKFLMLFLVSKPRMVNLDLAAKILIGDPNIDRTENAKFKTKIRRLYDIANILTSLDLIHKVHVVEMRGRKPAFKYTGPDVDANDINVSYNDHYHRPSSRHSMLDCVKNGNAADFIKNCGLQPVKSEDITNNQGCESKRKQATRKSMPRHSSFDQICQVAETERKRLYDSMSQPASPTEKMSFDDFPKSLSQEEPAKMEQMVAKSEKRNGSQRIYVVQQSGSHFQVVQQNSKNKSPGCSNIFEDRVVSTFVPKQQNSTSDSKEITSLRADKIIIKTKQPVSSMPLTKDQIDAVLKSLKVPVPVKKNEESKDVATNATTSTCIKTDIDKTPECQVKGNKRVNNNQSGEQELKRFRIEYPSPPTDDDEHQPRKKPDIPVKYSPQKALTAELMNAQSPALIADQNNSLSNAKNLTGSEMDLAVPFSENEDSCDSVLVHGSTSQVMKDISKSVQKIAVQFPNQEPTILQLPFVQMQSPNSCKETRQAPPHPANGLSQPMKIIQGVPMSATGVSGQPINFMVPVTFSPPLTPSSGPTSPNIFSFPGQSPQNVNYTSMQLPQQTAKYPNVVSTACSVVHSSPSPGIVNVSVPQLVTPTERPIIPPSSYFGNTPGGLIPLSTISAVTGNSTKEVFPTARKLDLPDISA